MSPSTTLPLPPISAHPSSDLIHGHKVYGLESGKKVHLILSVNPPTLEEKQSGVGVRSLVQYSDSLIELVPVSLLRTHCPEVGPSQLCL